MGKRLIAGLIVVGLAVGVWVLWPREGSDTTTTTLPVAAATTTSTTNATTTSSSTPDVTVATTTTRLESHVVETVEEAEEILRALLWSRYDAIFREDEGSLQGLVASDSALKSGVQSFGQLVFLAEPTLEGVVLREIEILRSDETCLALWADLDVTAFVDSDANSSAVVILRSQDNQWKWMALWRFKNDLWETDCDASLESVS